MNVKRLVAFCCALLIALQFEGPGRLAAYTTLLCPPSHAKLDAAVHDRIHTASIGAPIQVILSVQPGLIDQIIRLVALLGGNVLGLHASVSALTVVTAVGQLGLLAAAPGILSLSIDAPLLEQRGVPAADLLAARAAGGPAAPVTHLHETLGLDDRWTGAGVGVAVIDSGLELHAGMAGRVREFRDFTGGGGPPDDDFGHGTHVAGLIGGRGTADGRFEGVAPGVEFIVLKVLDANGAGRTSDVIRAIEFAIANKARLGIDIINLSLGHPIYEPAATDPLVRAVDAASRAGIVVVVSAGNYGTNPVTGLPGYAGVTSPANSTSAITVGALSTLGTVERSDDRIASFSSRGPTWYDARVKVDLAAPGDRLVATAARNSTLYRDYPALHAGDGYMRLSGTSMAAGVVSGVVALMLEASAAPHGGAHPALTPNAIKAALQYTAFAVGTNAGIPADMLTVGAGAINATGALEWATGVDTSQPVGERWVTTNLVRTTVLAGETLAWSTSLLWGSLVVAGDVVETHQPAWASAVVWGNTTTWGNAVVWGNTVVWGNAAVWSNAVVWGNHQLGVTDDNAVVWGNLHRAQP